jgi:hypothetical protein
MLAQLAGTSALRSHPFDGPLMAVVVKWVPQGKT